MILSKNSSIADLYSKGQPVQRLYSKGALVWERGGAPPDPPGVVMTDIKIRVFMTQDERGYDGKAFFLLWKLTNTVDGLIWIDWGDGTAITYSKNGAYYMIHSYTIPGEYIIHIKCRMTMSKHFLDLTENSYATEFLPGSHLGSDYEECELFLRDDNWSKIKRFPDGFFDYCINIERMGSLVSYNQSFNYIQPNIFKNLHKLKWLASGFCDVPNLTTIPDNIYPHPNIDTSSQFAGTPIRKIPHGIATVHPLIGAMFSEFTRPGQPNIYIDEIPTNYFECVSSVANLSSVDNVFADLPLVTSIPPTLFQCIPKVTRFINTFARSGITSIPLTLFENNPNIISFSNCFNGCAGITSDVPRLWETHPNADGTDCFRGCFNTIESGPTHNGYKFVWDFPTSASNGTIKCVTLTSGLGGRCGWWGVWMICPCVLQLFG